MAEPKIIELYKTNVIETPLFDKLISPSDWSVLSGQGGVVVYPYNIKKNSITVEQINFTPVGATDIVATINASTEGIDIDGAKIAINGSTTFAANYNPFLKVNTFFTDTIPTSIAAGDLWFDLDDSNKLYRAEIAGAANIVAGQWVLVRDSGIANAIAAAADAQATADGKIVTFIQATAPTAEAVGDIWIDSDDNQQYRWSGIQWVSVQDTGIAGALSAANDAQATADGKIVTFYQDAAPTAEGTGDIWFDTNDNKKPYRWSGAAWVEVEDANKLNAIAGYYASAASGARVLIFPSANIGIQVIDDVGNDVFKTLVGGADVGDVIFGDYAGGQGLKYDKSANSTTFSGYVVLNSAGHIRGGQTDYDTGEGFFMGYSGGTYKQSIGNTDNYMKWDGSYLRIKGNLDLTSAFTNVTFTVANLPIPPTTEGFNAPAAYE